MLWKIMVVLLLLVATNGFFTLAAGLERIFQFGIHLDLELEAVPEYLDVTPALQVGGFVSVVLGGRMVATRAVEIRKE